MEDKQHQNINEKGELNSHLLNELLKKYLSVWLWSILFGATTGLTYSLVGIRDVGKWGELSAAIVLLMTINIAFLIIAWSALFRFFKGYLIPGVFLGEKEPSTLENKRKSGEYLTRCFYALIMAGVFRLIIELSKQIFQVMLY
jgi:hypothetical protein